MGYPRDLDEYSENELLEELRKREYLREQNKCDYCGGSDQAKPCKFERRHQIGTTCGKLRNQLDRSEQYAKFSPFIET